MRPRPRNPVQPKRTTLPDTVALRSGAARADIATLGAEPMRWTISERELLWRSDAHFWARTSPILFPIVGWARGGIIRVDGAEFPLGVHGFAASQRFDVVETSAQHAVFTCQDNADTRRQFPFRFALTARYDLEPGHLVATFTVRNPGDHPLPYALGFHPGFAWPFSGGAREDYAIAFAEAERAFVPRITVDGLFATDERPVAFEDKRLRLSDTLFANEALCFLNARSRAVRFIAPDGATIEMAVENFPHLALWSRPGAPFVSIEAWTGHGDPQGFADDIREKPSMRLLAPGESARHTVSLGYIVSD